MKTQKKLKLGIVGYGFVGKATEWGFNKDVEKFIVDPLLENSIIDLAAFEPQIVFICVPTPMDKNGSQDSSIIREVIKDLSENCPEAIKVIKSTVLPDVLDDVKKLDKKIIYNPEFLREKHSKEDFKNSEMIIFGGDKYFSKIVSNAYFKNSRCKTKKHFFTDLKSASLIKYAINTFLCSKVIFFNELNDLYRKMNVEDDWNYLTEIISTDKRIGLSHMSVPGHDGRKGFGGACFPKDSMALIKFAEDIGVNLSSLSQTVKTNNKIRSKYKDLDSRESEQNVSFDDNI